MVNAATTTATGPCARDRVRDRMFWGAAGDSRRAAAVAVVLFTAPIGSDLVAGLGGGLIGSLGGCAGKRESAPPAQPGGGAAGPCAAELTALRDQLINAKRAVIIKPVADLLERPDPGSPLADQARLGDMVSVLPAPTDCRLPGGSLLPIQTAVGYRGYSAVEALMPWPSAAPPYRSGTLWRVVSRFANFYPQPDLRRSNPLVVLPLGVAVRHQRVVDERWVELALPDGRHGFAQRGDLHAEDPAPPFAAQCVVAQALAHEGSPYLWGGRSTYGIDCSGLVANAYEACGMLLPRDASQQFRWDGLRPIGQPVLADLGTLLPGDLLFFAAADAVPAAGLQPGDWSRAKITHVGVYLGDGRFVHATTSDQPTVHQSQLSEPAWLRRWVGTRRHPQLSAN